MQNSKPSNLQQCLHNLAALLNLPHLPYRNGPSPCSGISYGLSNISSSGIISWSYSGRIGSSGSGGTSGKFTGSGVSTGLLGCISLDIPVSLIITSITTFQMYSSDPSLNSPRYMLQTIQSAIQNNCFLFNATMLYIKN